MDPVPLPTQPIVRLTAPFVRFLRIEAAAGIVLLVATVLALVSANTGFADDYAALWNRSFTVGFDGARLSYPLWYWINDGLMAIFFFVIGLEIKRELMWGELRDRRNVVAPAIAALGGAVVPIAIYLVLQPSEPGRAGWAVPMATDIAFVVGCLAMLGSRVPPGLKIFVLSLAIIDDMLAVVLIAVAFSSSIEVAWLAAAAGGLGLVVGLARLGVRRIGIYGVVGLGVWLCTLKAGIHPTVAGVLLGLLTPARAWIGGARLVEIVDATVARMRGAEQHSPDRRDAAETLAFAATESVSPLERVEHGLHVWVAFAILPVFALANAGVSISVDGFGDPIAVATMVALTIGKPVGIVGAVWLGVRSGLVRLPQQTSWPALIGASWLAGIGFTMALFIASLSVPAAALGATKSGILAGSAISMIGGMSILVWALRRRGDASADA